MVSEKNGELINAKNLSKTFYQGSTPVHALRDANLKVNRGEFIAIMGASGSGKSTLLHLLAGLLKPDGGSTLSIAGQDLTRESSRKLARYRREKVGLVFQGYNLVRSLDVAGNIRIPLLLGSRVPDEAERVSAMIDQLGMTERKKHRPRHLSGGEQQRVAIGRAMIAQQELVLADEPTGNLDLKSGKQICELLRDLADRQNRTIVMVTHAPHVAIYADRILMLRDGKIVEDRPMSHFQDAVALSAHYQTTLEATEKVDAAEEATSCD